jgi:flagellar FliL protein
MTDTSAGEEGVEAADEEKKKAVKDHAGEDNDEEKTNEFVQLSNQFVVPIISEGKVTALVVLALSIEVPAGKSETVLLREPKLRDSFLRVLFDHASIGGFEGNFTDAQVLDRLRSALKEVAERDLGKELAKDVLIVEIARQDY